MAMQVSELQQSAIEFWHSVDSEVLMEAAIIGVEITAGLFAARTLAVAIARVSGLYHPDQYHRWPRVPWRPFYLSYMFLRKWYERVFIHSKRANGGFASTLAMLSLLYKPGKLFLGRAYGAGVGWFQPLGIKLQRHLFIYAMTGSGKTTLIETMVATWRGSVYLVDVEAQVTNALSARDWRTWYVFDPFGISDQKSISINFIDCVKEAMEREGADAAVRWSYRIAVAIIVTPSGARSPYFYSVSRQFLAGLILHVITTHPEEEHNLAYIRVLIRNGYRLYNEDGQEETKAGESHELLLHAMLKNDAYEGAIAGYALSLVNASGETGGNVRSTLMEQTQFLDIPEVRRHILTSSIPISALKTRNDIVISFACELFSLREELFPLSRLFTNLNSYTFEAVKKKKGLCLTINDELPSQRYNEVNITTLAAGRKHGQVFVGISVNVELMRNVYPNSYKSFSGEADACIYMGANHPETREFLEKELDKKTIVEKDRRTGRNFRHEVPVMDKDQIKRFLDPDSGHMILVRAGGRPVKAVNEPGYKALPVWRYAPSKEHGENFLRRFFRMLFDRKRNTPTELHEDRYEQDLLNNIDPVNLNEPEYLQGNDAENATYH